MDGLSQRANAQALAAGLLTTGTAAASLHVPQLVQCTHAASRQPYVSLVTRTHLGTSAMRTGRKVPDTCSAPATHAATAAASCASSASGRPSNSCCVRRSISRSVIRQGRAMDRGVRECEAGRRWQLAGRRPS